ncbi:MAG: redox-regulated ATPase YchF [Chitinophagales bacterium]
MGLKCGIVGLPNVGKSTLFNCLSNAQALSANYPFATIDPNIGIVNVPDERMTKLAELVNPKRVVPTTVEIVDIAGLVKGASKGEGLGNKFLSDIRDTDAIVHVVRCFDNDNIIHVSGSVDPVRDKEIIDFELQLKDLESVEKRLDKYKKQSKGGASKETKKGLEVLTEIKDHLEQGKSVRSADLEDHEWQYIEELNLLTAKPVLYVCNVDDEAVVDGNAHTRALSEAVAGEYAEVLIVSAAAEAEISQMESVEERLEFLEMMGLEAPGINKLINACYKLLKLITYFTAGEKEVRAWTITEGTKAPGAAGVIHTDFEKGFIRAEVIKYAAYIEHKSESAVKAAGKMSVEGKEYVVADGDVMHFRFNV